MKKVLKGALKKAFPTLAANYKAYKSLIKNKNSYLHSTGWMESLARGYPCKKNGLELPWLNYPIIEFLEKRLKGHFTLFEYGSGNSTLFFSRVVNEVTSVEHDEVWYEAIKARSPENVKLIFREKDYDGNYCRSIKLDSKRYDVVIVDGRDRVNCIKQSIEAVSAAGVILLDDSQREEYLEGINYAKEKGFLAVDFEGLKPTGNGIFRATILYRRGNCLDI